MALKAVIDQTTYDGLGDIGTEHYAAVEGADGSYRLDVTAIEGFSLAEVDPLRKALESERTLTKKARKDLSTLKESFKDLDPTVSREAIAKLAEMGDTDLSKDEKFQMAKKQLEDKFAKDRTTLEQKHATDVETLNGTLKKTRGQLSNVLIDSAAATAIANLDGTVDLLLPLVRNVARLKESDDGKGVVVIVDSVTGDERISTKPGSSEPMTIEEFVGTLKDNEKLAGAFKGSGATGSGSTSSAKPSGHSGAFTMTNAQASNLADYERMKKAANEAGKEVTLSE